MQGLITLLLLLLILTALAVSLTRRLLPAVILFMFYSLILSMIWLLLESPDLAITEAAVGAGVTSVMLFAALKRLGKLEDLSASKEAKEEKVSREEKEDDRHEA